MTDLRTGGWSELRSLHPPHPTEPLTGDTVMGNNTLPSILPDDTPRARKTDNLNSHEAADATATSVAATQAAVLGYLRTHGDHTDHDIEQALADQYSPARVRTARSELKHRGLVVGIGRVLQDGARAHRTLWAAVE